VTMTSNRQTKVDVFIVGSLSQERAHNLLYGGVCSSTRVCAGVCKGVHCIVERDRSHRHKVDR